MSECSDSTPPPETPQFIKEENMDYDGPDTSKKPQILDEEDHDQDGPSPPKKQELTLDQNGETISEGNENKLSEFSNCTGEENKNEGIFSVVAIHFYPLGSFKEQNNDKVELILADSKNTWILFVGDEDIYLKLEEIRAGQVICMKVFKWNTIEERGHSFVIPGLDYKKRGKLMENTTIKVLPHLSHLAAQFKKNEHNIYSLSDCVRSITGFTAMLNKVQMNKNTRCGDVLSLRFLTSDNKQIQLGLFGDQSHVEWNLIEGKKYRVTYAKGDKTNTAYASASFYGTPRTTIEAVEDIEQTAVNEITNISEIITDTGEVFGGTFWFRDVMKTLSGKTAVALDGFIDDMGFANAVLVQMPMNMDITNHAVKRVKFTAAKKGHNMQILLIDGSVEVSEKAFEPQLAKHRISFK